MDGNFHFTFLSAGRTICNSQCHQICLPISESSWRCACADGYMLRGKICRSAGWFLYILLFRRSDFFYILLRERMWYFFLTNFIFKILWLDLSNHKLSLLITFIVNEAFDTLTNIQICVNHFSIVTTGLQFTMKNKEQSKNWTHLDTLL